MNNRPKPKYCVTMGSCRQLFMNKSPIQIDITYPHYTKEILQLIKYCKYGESIVTQNETNYTFRTPILHDKELTYSDKFKNELEKMDVCLIEIASKKVYKYNHLYVDMVLGNTCSYSCSYCPDSLHDGSVPWHSIDNLKKFTSRVLSHYSTNLNKQFYTFNFLGGEPSLYKHLIELCDHVKNESEKYNTKLYRIFGCYYPFSKLQRRNNTNR